MGDLESSTILSLSQNKKFRKSYRLSQWKKRANFIECSLKEMPPKREGALLRTGFVPSSAEPQLRMNLDLRKSSISLLGWALLCVPLNLRVSHYL